MRIVSLSPSVTEILFSLDLGQYIVANTYFCDYPPAAKKIPKAGDFSHLNIEKIKAFKPDFVITSTVVQKNASKLFKKEKFRHLHFDPRSLNDIYNSILDLGKVFGADKKADVIVNEMKDKALVLTAKGKLPFGRKKFRVYAEEWFDPPMISGNWVPNIIEIAGGKYFPLAKGSQSKEISLEKIIQFDPEVILLSDCGYGRRSDLEKIYHRKKWEKLTAVKNKNVFAVDESILNRPGPRILQAASEIKNILIRIDLY